VRQRVVFHRWMQVLLNRVTYRVLRAARHRWPTQTTLAKAEGMARFYLEGRKPLAQQVWPECCRGGSPCPPIPGQPRGGIPTGA
jgi:hypothetical protein